MAKSMSKGRAGLPQEVMMKDYPKRDYPCNDNVYPDDLEKMDRNYNSDAKKIKKQRSDNKW